MNNHKSLEIKQLTGIRFFAAIWIVILHYYMFLKVSFFINFKLFVPLIKTGYLALDIFFVLSGYVIFLGYSSKFKSQLKLSNILKYWLYRIIRLYPLYIITLFIILTLYHLGLLTQFVENFGAFTIEEFIFCIFLIQSWNILEKWTWNIPSWTVSTEWALYLLSPFFINIIQRLNKYSLIFIILSLILLDGALGYFINGFLITDAMQWGIYRGMIEFCIGAIFYELAKNINPSKYFDVIFSISCIAIVALSYFNPNKFLLVILTILSILSLTKANGSVKKFLSLKLINYLGLVAYPLYLLQFTFQNISNELVMHESFLLKFHTLFFWITILILILIACIFHTFIDVPLRSKISSTLKISHI